ncbi:unnamed protein product [Ceratitis capitata]|uniref:(Mediterranean fruit fly) hypothetical protein n=1 Tax=Ceratitis capitata TaxID=7213 RepID=A0A811U8F9_CERCA|nr:unnamed protein product [Ceratitis capitata]
MCYKYFNELARQAHTSKISLRHTALEGLCPPRDPPTCMPASARYRTHDGTCNSRRRPRWGAAQMPFNRFLPPEYGDGVDSIRLSMEGGPLASSRFVSLLVHGARDGEAAVTLMTAQWGQLLDHDMTSTAQPRSINGSVPSCCGNTDFHPSCFPIKVPLDDPWLAPLKVRCLEFLRSAPAQRRDCILSWREQTNQATSYIDASPIYSNSVKSSDNARVFRNGLLIYGRGNPAEDVCQRGAIATQCIRAGDGRSGEQPGLLALHHVWVGEHNRIALELSDMNLHWSDEKIYQETRRIVGAMFQHITYREFLPIVLGREVCKLFDLELLSTGFYNGYDPKTNPTVANSFAAAAFRFGHSLVQNSYMRCDRFHNFMRNNVSLHEEFQRGDIGSPGSLHRLLRGLVNQRALKRDEFITPELTNHLFQTPGFPFGLDLAAINIQRGRDHGVPPYTSWRVPCGLTSVNSWDDFANVVGPQSAQRISHAYRSVHDIDLFVGGIAERPVVGGLVGPTFACIIAQQFSNSRKGDRFWYENGDFENSFTPAQLQSIRRVSLAQVLCRAVGGGTLQPHVLLPTDVEGNERQICGTGTLAPLDLSPWIEQDPFANSPTTQAQEPEHVFDIITTNKIGDTLPTGSVQVVKENKAGFPNRQRPPTDQKQPANGFVTGVKVPGEIIHISDKLDIRQKVTPAKRPTVTAKPIKGINNKIDKSPTKITLNVRGVTIRRQQQGTRHTTVVVNNIPLELRSATEDENTLKTHTKTVVPNAINEVNTAENSSAEKVEARIDDTPEDEQTLLNGPPNTDEQVNKQRRLNKTHSENRLNLTTLTDLSENESTFGPQRTSDQSSSTKEKNPSSDKIRQSKLEQDEKAYNEQTPTSKSTDDKFKVISTSKDNEDKYDDDFIGTSGKPTTTESDDEHADYLISPDIQYVTTETNLTTETEKDLVPKTEANREGTESGEATTSNRTETETGGFSKDDKNETKTNIQTDLAQSESLAIQPLLNDNHENNITTDDIFLKSTNAAHLTPELDKKVERTDNQTADLNPIEKLLSKEEETRFKRRRPDNNRKLIVVKVPSQNNELKNRFQTKPTKSVGFKKLTAATPLTNLTTRSTPRQVELRQYQTQPTFYTRPQKVVVNGPNADQYEIEINIRQTNKQAASALPITASTSAYKPFHYDRYSPSYVGTYYSSTVPPQHGYYANTPTVSPNLVQTRRTKPPTVIYIDEHEDRYTSTTRTPGLFQNIITFATSGFGNFNKPPQQSPHSSSVQKEPASYGQSVSNVHEINQIVQNPDTASISHYIPRPTSQNALSAFPAAPAAASLSQVGGVASNGVVQATSSAISAGNFGTIVGVAQSNGADSTFSFNIRPKPNVVGQSQLPLPPNQIDGGSYGLLPSGSPPYNQVPNPSFLTSQHSVALGQSHFGNTQKEKPHSPFSSENNRPPQKGSYGYYARIQNLSLHKKTNSEHVLTLSDYDEIEISRTLEPIMKNNTTVDDFSEEVGDVDDGDDYDYGDSDGDGSDLSEKFVRDGYMRPELMIQAMVKSQENELRNLTATNNCTTKILDDNYVLPVLNATNELLESNYLAKTLQQSNETEPTTVTTNEKLYTESSTPKSTDNTTNYPEIEGKHLDNDILAEDYEDETTEALIASKVTVIKTLTNERQLTKKTETESAKDIPTFANQVAFAPIKILTKLERPDNWLIYDSPKNYPLLPELPAMSGDSSAPADEVPKPIQGLAGIWLKKIQKQKEKNRVQSSANSSPMAIERTIPAEAGRGSEVFTTVSSTNVSGA